MTDEPQALLARLREGDAVAFEEVIRRYDGVVRGIVSRMWSGAFDREEAMQEIWLHVWTRRGGIDPARADAFGGWLATLARRRAIDLLRARGRGVETALEDGPILQVGPEQPGRLRSAEVEAAVKAFESRLRPQWQDFFRLYFVEGLDYAEISQRLGITKLRCRYMKKVLLGRARRSGALKAALGVGRETP